MSVARNQIGNQAQVVRPTVQANLDYIDLLLMDPDYVRANNQRKSTDDPQALIFEFSFSGVLNNAELAAAQDGWITQGWTSATVMNSPLQRFDSLTPSAWKLRLVYTP